MFSELTTHDALAPVQLCWDERSMEVSDGTEEPYLYIDGLTVQGSDGEEHRTIYVYEDPDVDVNTRTLCVDCADGDGPWTIETTRVRTIEVHDCVSL